jgi:predicted DNA-binding transcriptional regulator AlpA
MQKLSTDQVAKLLGLDPATLSRYIKAGKLSAPEPIMAGGMRMRLWSESDIERLKEVLPKIANGRKTRYKKQKAPTARRGRFSAQQSRQARDRSAKTKAQPTSAVPRKKRSSKKPKPASG